MWIFPHQLSTCVTTALKRFWTMFRWCKYERVGWCFWWGAPHVFFWILCVREYRNCWQFRCNSSRKLRICLTTSPATPSKQCWRCRVALSLVLDLRISSAWWRGGSAVRIPSSCLSKQCAVLVRNTTLHRRGSGDVGHMPWHTSVTTWASPGVMISQKGCYPTIIVMKYHMAGPIRTSMWFRENDLASAALHKIQSSIMFCIQGLASSKLWWASGVPRMPARLLHMS